MRASWKSLLIPDCHHNDRVRPQNCNGLKVEQRVSVGEKQIEENERSSMDFIKKNQFAILDDDKDNNDFAGLIKDTEPAFVSNVESSIIELQNVLKFTPLSAKVSKKKREFEESIVSGFVKR